MRVVSVLLGFLLGLAAVALGSSTLDVYFIDVGHGDAILIDCGDWEALIDAGGGTTTATANVLEVLASQVDDKVIELAIVSHLHEDHYGGFDAVFDRFEVLEVRGGLDSDPDTGGEAYAAFRSGLIGEALTPEPWECGDRMTTGCLVWTVLGPPAIVTEPEDANDNANSLVLLLRFGSVGFLFPGDTLRVDASDIVTIAEACKTLVLLAPHHGCAESESALADLVAYYRPDLVVFSTNLCTPNGAEDLLARGVPFITTARSGLIHMRTDGASAWVTTATLAGENAPPECAEDCRGKSEPAGD
jgi:competence protein ComEC